MAQRLLFCSIVLLCASCSAGNSVGVATAEDCIARYAVPSGSEIAVNVAIRQCRAKFSPEATEKSLARADCLLPKLATARSDQGARAAVMVCRRLESADEAAAAGAGEHGPWENY